MLVVSNAAVIVDGGRVEVLTGLIVSGCSTAILSMCHGSALLGSSILIGNTDPIIANRMGYVDGSGATLTDNENGTSPAFNTIGNQNAYIEGSGE